MRSIPRSRRWMSATRGRQPSAMAAARAATASGSPPSTSSQGAGGALFRAMSAMARRRSSSPAPSRAAVSTTGTPSAEAKAAVSGAACFFRASSIRLTHTTSRPVRQRSCTASCKFRRRQVASATSTVTSASPRRRNSSVTASSGEWAYREYVPGRSTSRNSAPPQAQRPSAAATVLPHQLPVCWCRPVRALNTVDLPTLGLPASAAVYRSISRPLLFRHILCGEGPRG